MEVRGVLQFVAGVGGEAPLARERLLAAGEGCLQAGQECVDRGGEASYLILRVRHGQAFREVFLAHRPRCAGYGLHRPQGGPRQQVGTAYGEDEGRPDAGGQDGPEGLDAFLRRLVGFAGLDHPGAPFLGFTGTA